MERSRVLDVMGRLTPCGMTAADDEISATALKRQYEPRKIVGDLLTAEISAKQARSIKYQTTFAKLPLAEEIDELDVVASARGWRRVDCAPGRGVAW